MCSQNTFDGKLATLFDEQHLWNNNSNSYIKLCNLFHIIYHNCQCDIIFFNYQNTFSDYAHLLLSVSEV